MTEPPVIELNEMQLEIAKRMATSAGNDAWSELRLRVFAIGPTAQSALWRVPAEGDEERIRDLASAGVALHKMRHAMGKGPGGAWFTAVATLKRTGDFDFTFDYQTEPEWNIAPDREAYLRDIAEYPRPADQIPAWHPAHQSA